MSDLMLDVALELASVGLRVFPLDETSCIPIFANWPSKATRDPALIKSWWTDKVTGWHRPYNVGVATGDGLLVIDVDVKEGGLGDQSLEAMEALIGELPDGPRVRTASGGRHIYLRTPAGTKIGNTAGTKLGPNLDTRGHHGFVVAAGSAKEGLPYVWEEGRSLKDCAIPALPQAYLDLLKSERKKKDAPSDLSLDNVGNVAAAREYLLRADPAIEFQGGNTHTFRVAAAVRDYGVSEEVCLELMLESWNELCEPPWGVSELSRVVENAYKYSENAAGCLSAEAMFSEIETETTDKPRASSTVKFSPVMPFDPLTLPKRRWIVQDMLCRSQLSWLVARSGAGKTTWDFNLALAIATGRSEICGFKVKERAKVWYFNGEDDRTELDRRLAAALQAHGVSWDDVAGHLFMDSGLDLPLKLANRKNRFGSVQRSDQLDDIIAEAKERDIGVIMIDPLQELHDADENDNVEMREIAGALRDLSWQTNAAVLAVHHTRKPSGTSANGDVGDMDSGRGASSIQGVCRIYLTMGSMTEQQAEKEGVHVDRKNHFVQVHVTKNNLGMAHYGQWLQRLSVPLGRPDLTGASEQEEGVDYVGALKPVKLGRDRPVPVTVHDIAQTWPRRQDRMTCLELAQRLNELPTLADDAPERIAEKAASLLWNGFVLDGFRYEVQTMQQLEITERPVSRKKTDEPDTNQSPPDEFLYAIDG